MSADLPEIVIVGDISNNLSSNTSHGSFSNLSSNPMLVRHESEGDNLKHSCAGDCDFEM